MPNQTPELSDCQHAAILQAYVGRLTVNDIEKIAEAVRRAWFASQNLGLNSQIATSNALDAVVLEILGKMIAHDKQTISSIINKHFPRPIPKP